MEKMTYSAVVFDLFHTLVDPEEFRPRDFHRVNRVAEHCGIDVDAFTSYWREVAPIRNRSRSRSVIELVDDYLASVRVKVAREILKQVEFELGHYQDLAIIHPRPEVEQALSWLAAQGLKVGLLSNADEREIRLWPRSPLARYFTTVCFSCDTGYEKPQPEAYACVLDGLDQPPAGSVVYVGDGGSDELQGAQTAGIGLVVLMTGFVSANGLRTPKAIGALESVADCSIQSLQELQELLA
jgi:putative hydrolase of the HAD superfamily